MGAPLVTVFIPTYKRPELLSRAIESVLNQTYASLQLCIYDNASGDETASTVAHYAKMDPRVKYHCHEKNIGHAANFNHGLMHVDTPFFLTLSDDDVIFPDCIETLMEGFIKYPDAMCSIGSSFDVSSQYVPGGYIDRVPLLMWPREGYYAPSESLLYMLQYYPNWASALFRREVVDRVGGICCDNVTIDYDYMMRVAARCPIVVSRKPCAIFLMHNGSQSSLAEYGYVWPGWANIIARLKNDDSIPPEIKQESERAIIEKLKSYLMILGVNSLIMGRFNNCRTAASILHDEMGEENVPLILSSLSNICESSGAMHNFFISLCRLKSGHTRRKNRRIHEENKKYLIYLKLPQT
jgi:glycosyltransferase involved in cell wall biosynthesis